MNRIQIVMDERWNRSNCYECAQVIMEDDTGQKKERLVTVESLVKAMMHSFVCKRVSIVLGKVPFGYYEAEVGMLKEKLCATVITVLPASRQIVRYEETAYDVCLPSLVFRFRVEQERITTTEVYVQKDEKPTDKSRLYHYPFGNVNREGTVCWGNNRLPQITELKTLESVMMLFIQSPGNEDLYEGERCCGHKSYALRQLLEKLKDEERYPDDFLVPIKRGNKGLRIKDLMAWKC